MAIAKTEDSLAADLRASRRPPPGKISLYALASILPLMDGAMLFGGLLFGGLLLARRLDAIGIAYALVTLTVLASTGMQHAHINPRLGDDLPRLAGQMAMVFATLAIITTLTIDSAHALGTLSRVALASMVLVALGRACSYAVIRSARARGFLVERTLIVGAGTVGAELATILHQHPEYGMVPVGFLDSFESTGLPIPILGDVHDLVTIIERHDVTRVIVAFGAIGEAEMVRVLRECDQMPVEVYVVPRFFELGVTPAASFAEDLWGIPLIRLRRSALRTSARVIKRAFDLVVASLLFILTAPLILICAIVVRCSSPGPVLFRQKRVGKNGQLFEIMKFRTMLENGDSETTWSVVNDNRKTRIGAILRRTSLDELPQLINVLQGQMSLIGPRPERAYFASRFSLEVPHYDDRHRVQSGLTGWAQIHGLKGDTPISDRARFDNQYIEHWSLWRDIVIFGRTVFVLLKLSGEPPGHRRRGRVGRSRPYVADPAFEHALAAHNGMAGRTPARERRVE
jgi:exopolysaccharide biosynthesis polyprenyl glycosylphosphotransferase